MAKADGSGTSWWLASLGAITPSLVLAAAGGLLGPVRMPGAALVALAAVYVLVELVLIQPIIDRRLGGRPSLARVAREFLQRALAAPTPRDVTLELAGAASRALGVDRTLLIAPAPGGGVDVLGDTGRAAAAVGEAETAFVWLGEYGEPADRALLSAQDTDGARGALALLERLAGEVLLPLRLHGQLLGVAVLGTPERPVPADELGRFYRAIAAHTAMALANCYLDPAASGRGTLARNLDLATAVQEALLPDARPVRIGGLSLRGLYRPVAECGGDLWTFADLGEGRVLVLIADATGHGAAPALLTAVARGAVEAECALRGASLEPAALLAALNRHIHRAGHTRYLMTAFAAVVNQRAGELAYANAGQNFPYVMGRDAEGKLRLEPLVARGDTLGAAPEVSYADHRRPFRAGDRLILFTDGIVDAGSPSIEPYGEKRFRAALTAAAGQAVTRLPDRVFDDVDRFLGGQPVSDDMTIVAVALETSDGDDAAGNGVA